jgi:SAM-dependent methyltransferase
MDQNARFDQAYYDRFYLTPKSRVTSAEEHSHLARFVFEFAHHNGIELTNVLDVGAGIGLWKRWFEKNAKKVTYRGTEVSDAMCKEHGFEKRDIARWRDRELYDLVICQGVLQYLPDPDVAPAIANLAAMSKGLVYLEITTRVDLKERCDTDRTDVDIFVRNGSYYRAILQKYFLQVGAGLWWSKEYTPPFFELEMIGSAK